MGEGVIGQQVVVGGGGDSLRFDGGRGLLGAALRLRLVPRHQNVLRLKLDHIDGQCYQPTKTSCDSNWTRETDIVSRTSCDSNRTT